MKGNNTLELNQATIVAAVQMYLDAQFSPDAKQVVNSVTTKGSGGNGYNSSGLFVVELSERESAFATKAGT